MTTFAIPYEPLQKFGFQRVMPGRGWQPSYQNPEEIRDTTKLMEINPAEPTPTLANYLGKVLHGASIIVRRVRDTLYVPHRVKSGGRLIYEETQEDSEIERLSDDETSFILKNPARIEIPADLRKSFIAIARYPIARDIEPTLDEVYAEIIKYKEPLRTTLEWEFDCAALARSIGDPERYIRKICLPFKIKKLSKV